METQAKQCYDCREEKLLTQFHRDKVRDDGLKVYCKECCKKRKRERHQRLLSGEKPYIALVSKVCLTCGLEKPAADFGLNSNANDGKQPHCKLCENVSQMQRLQQYADGTRPYRPCDVKYCSGCKTVKSHMEFSGNKYAADGLHSYCKPCAMARQTQHNRAKPEVSRAATRRRRARKKQCGDVSLTIAQWQFVLAKQKGRCYYCGRKRRLTQDHILALMNGGTHTMDNVIAACHSCNSRKGTRPPPIPVQPCLVLGFS